MHDRRRVAAHLARDESSAFVETLSALRRLILAAEPHVATLDENPRFGEAIREVEKTLGAEDRLKFSATLVAANGFIRRLVMGGLTKGFTPLEGGRGPKPDAQGEEGRWNEIDPLDLIDDDEVRAEVAAELHRIQEESGASPDFRAFYDGHGYQFEIGDPHISGAFWRVIGVLETELMTPRHSEILRRSILTMVVSGFEVLVGSLRRCHLMSFVESLGSRDKQFSLSDLLSFESLDDAIDAHISREVEAFTRSGFREWCRWLRTDMKIDVDELAIDWAETEEVFERRNIVVHHSGQVSRQYLSHVATHLTEGLSEGQALHIEEDYLDRAIDHLLTLGILMAFRVRTKLFDDREASLAASWLLDCQFELLQKGRHGSVRQIATGVAGVDMDQDRLLRIRVNRWIAMDAAEDCEVDLTDELSDWDTSALDRQFLLAKYVLMRDDQMAVDLLERLIADDELSAYEVATWPLFRRLRETGQVDDLMPQVVEVDESSDREQPQLP